MAYQRTFCIFSTAQVTLIGDVIYDYSKDNIVYDKAKEEYTAIYQCQKSMKRYDDILTDPNVKLILFQRATRYEPFKYIGGVQSRKVLEERRDGAARLTMQYKIPKQGSLDIPSPTTRGQGKYKIPVFNALNLQPMSKCYMHGIMEVVPKSV